MGEQDGRGRKEGSLADSLDVDAMIRRFRERAKAVKNRPLPPIAGEERARFIEQAKIDFQDFAIIGDAKGEIRDGILHLWVDLRPPQVRGTADSSETVANPEVSGP